MCPDILNSEPETAERRFSEATPGKTADSPKTEAAAEQIVDRVSEPERGGRVPFPKRVSESDPWTGPKKRFLQDARKQGR